MRNQAAKESEAQMTQEEKEVAWERISDQRRDDKMTDFLDEIILERTVKNPDFPKMVEDKMTENELKEIEARASAATPGEWRVETYRDEDADLLIDGTGAASMNTSSECGLDRQEDMVFVAHAREDIPALIAEVRRFHKIRSMLHVIVRRGIVQYCPFCSSDVRENHSGFCEMFTPEGELK